MRKAQGNYNAIAEYLQPHQLRTLEEYAAGRGEDQWHGLPICCALARSLAVDNLLTAYRREGLSEKQALTRVAVALDLDISSLLRQRRKNARRNSPDY